MKINKKKYSNNIKKLNLLIHHLKNFFDKKSYKKKNFLKKFQNELFLNIGFKISINRLAKLLIIYNNNKVNIEKVNKLIINIDNSLDQSGGFFYNKYDNKYLKIFNIIDFLFDIINLIPNNILSSENNIKLPYSIFSIIFNLSRGDYDFSFYSLLGAIPGIGAIISSTLKIIHRIIRFSINRTNIYKYEDYYKQIHAVRRVHTFLKNEDFDKLKNPYLDDFENQFNLKDIDNLFLK